MAGKDLTVRFVVGSRILGKFVQEALDVCPVIDIGEDKGAADETVQVRERWFDVVSH